MFHFCIKGDGGIMLLMEHIIMHVCKFYLKTTGLVMSELQQQQNSL